LSSHLVGQKPIKITMAKNIVCTLVISQSIWSFREVVKVLGVDRRNVKKATKRRILLDTSWFAFWTIQQWAKRSNIISKEVKQLVKSWWTTKTKMSHNWKEVTSRWITTKTFEEHPTHYLQIGQAFSFLWIALSSRNVC
jgi:hypothetical protein